MFSGPAAVSCIDIAASTEAQEFLFVAANAKPVAGDVWSYQVGSGLGRASASTVSADAELRALGAIQPDSNVVDFRSTFEDRLRRNERQLLGERSVSALARARASAGAVSADDMSATRLPTAAPVVGDVVSYRVGNAASANFCSNYTEVRAVVRAVGSKAVIAQDVTAPARGFSDEQFRDIAAEFDNLIYPVDAQWFGDATDINADRRITILYTPAINRLSPPGTTGFVGGFFFLSDLLPRSVPAQQWRCDASNEQEIIYLLTPDPDGTINGNRHTVQSALESTRGVLAHELQHMINQGKRQTGVGSGRVEATWLNEGLSHFAEEAVGRASRGYGDYRKLTWNDVLVELDDFDSFFRQNLIRLRYWMDRPDQASPVSLAATSQLAPRGAAWALVRYSIDQYSRGDAKAFVRALVSGPEIDVANLEARARVPFDEILPGFLLANFGGTASSGAAPRFSYASWDMRDAMDNLNGGISPLRTTPLATRGASQSPSGSGSYFTLARPASSGVTSYRMLSPSGGVVDVSDARVFLLRVK